MHIICKSEHSCADCCYRRTHRAPLASAEEVADSEEGAAEGEEVEVVLS